MNISPFSFQNRFSRNCWWYFLSLTIFGYYIMLTLQFDDTEIEDNSTIIEEPKNEQKITSKIVGGTPAKKGEFPWLAMLTDEDLRQFCGGALLNRRFVLTASHCLDGEIAHNPSLYLRVRLGAFRSDLLEKGSKTHRVKRVVIHPDYDDKEFTNDIALVELQKKAKYSKKVKPINLPEESFDITGEMAVIAGWGSTYSNSEPSDELLKAEVPILSQKECKNIYGDLGTIFSEDMLCAGGKDKDTCQGDSGGPLFWNDENDWYIVGVVSWGLGCAKYPGVYSNVQYALSWIEKTMGDDVGGKIVEGEEATKEEFPWMASIFFPEGKLHCGGILLNHRYILTAAHCIDSTEFDHRGFDFRVRLGAFTSNIEEEGSVMHQIESFFLHPNWFFNDSRAMISDMALLKLQDEVQFTDLIKPIDLPDGSFSSEDLKEKLAIVTGWGVMDDEDEDPSDVGLLQKVEIPIRPNTRCKEIFAKLGQTYTEDMTCAGGDGQESCPGDTGGPLVWKNEKDVWFVIGVSSWGLGCDDMPTVYSSVLYALPWIHHITDETPKTIEGEQVEKREFPWMAMICYSNGTQFCTGSLISSRYVLTSVQCIRIESSRNVSILVRLGTLHSDTEENGALKYDVRKILQHPNNTNSETYKCDVALLFLEEDVIFGETVRPIYFPFFDLNLEGKGATVAGWGFAKGGMVEKSDNLLRTDILVLPNSECNEAYGFNIGENKLCVGGDELNSCMYDAGGPLMWKNPDGVWFIVGVMSYGFCGVYPNVYTRIKDVMHWILGTLIRNV